jgi:hypothetical protein
MEFQNIDYPFAEGVISICLLMVRSYTKKKYNLGEVASDKLLTTIDDLTKGEEELKHNFVIVIDVPYWLKISNRIDIRYVHC